MVSFDLLTSSVRYALRQLASNPGFALAAVVSLALGIGANSAIFSFLDAALLRPLDVPRASELVKIRASTPQTRFGRHTYREYVAFRDRTRTLSGIAAQTTAWLALKAGGEQQPRPSYAQLVDGRFFRTLEVRAALGHTLTPEDDLPARPIAVVLSDQAWRTRFNADAGIVGSAVTLNAQPAVIVGVLPRGFNGTDMNERPAIYVPLAAADRLFPSDPPLDDPAHPPHIVMLGRLRPGVAAETAQADLTTIAEALRHEYPETNRDRSVVVMGEIAARFALSPRNAALVALLAGLVAMVLLIASINVANLLLGRASVRVRELKIRAAVGASRGQLIGQLLIESVVLAGLGAAAGLMVASWAIRFFATLQIPADTPMELSTRLDARVLVSTLIAMAASVLFFSPQAEGRRSIRATGDARGWWLLRRHLPRCCWSSRVSIWRASRS